MKFGMNHDAIIIVALAALLPLQRGTRHCSVAQSSATRLPVKKRLGASFKEDEFWVGGKGTLCEKERGEMLGERKQKMNFG